jgi:hypothetical protein
MTHCSPTTLELVEAAVPPGPPGVRGMIVAAGARSRAKVTVRKALRLLVAAGRVRCEGRDRRRRYWRPL